MSCNSSSASESGGKITCTLELSSSTTKKVTIKTSYSGTATAGTDYSGNTTSHTIAAGKTSTSWTLTGKSDSKTEGNETIIINVTSVTNATESGSQKETLTLTDVESVPTVSLSCTPSSASESGGTITCTLELSSSTTKTVTVKVSYSGTATAGTDYSGNTTTHTISAGSTSTSWKLTGKSDTTTEGNETIVINVTSATNATESGSQKETLTLTDVESVPTVSLSCTPSSASESGGTFTCTLSLSASTTKTVTVEVAYSGSATAGSNKDYTGNTASHTISAGSTSTNWTITGIDDYYSSWTNWSGEGDETIVVDIDSVTNAAESGNQQETLTLSNLIPAVVSASGSLAENWRPNWNKGIPVGKECDWWKGNLDLDGSMGSDDVVSYFYSYHVATNANSGVLSDGWMVTSISHGCGTCTAPNSCGGFSMSAKVIDPKNSSRTGWMTARNNLRWDGGWETFAGSWALGP